MALNEEHLMSVPGVLNRYVRLSNGAKAHYITAGETGPAVILLHGGIVGSSGFAGWRFMLPALAQAGFRVFAPDRPGFGFADTRPEYRAQTWLDQVDFLDRFADALCIDKFWIGGNSNGTQHSFYYMVNHPNRILGACLVATAGIAGFAGVPAEKHYRKPPSGQPSPQFDGTLESMKALLDPIIWRKEGLTQDLLEMRTYAANMQKDSRTARPNGDPDDANMQQWIDLGDRLPKLDSPMIYLHGMLDVSAPVENAVIAEPYLPNIQFFYPDPCGHQGQTDQPDMFNAVFNEFMRDGKVSRQTADWAGVSKNRAENPKYVEQAAAAVV